MWRACAGAVAAGFSRGRLLAVLAERRRVAMRQLAFVDRQLPRQLGERRAERIGQRAAHRVRLDLVVVAARGRDRFADQRVTARIQQAIAHDQLVQRGGIDRVLAARFGGARLDGHGQVGRLIVKPPAETDRAEDLRGDLGQIGRVDVGQIARARHRLVGRSGQRLLQFRDDLRQREAADRPGRFEIKLLGRHGVFLRVDLND